MKLIGLGNDIIEISRIEKAISKNGFIEKVFSSEEIEVIKSKGNRSESYGGRFAAKEAISKALGTGVRNFKLVDIVILNDSLGKPYVIFKNNLEKYMKNYIIEISISHCKEYATAVAIIFAKGE
ncbi:holo-[acyl-carrier-protein] synthase [Cetobacterium ceti]|uniref:Holo-[acyl-carrier-protein] synthase n=1 Tax=Cetobacterium ceti TaxID=180163 RepID=A0A1T4Q105_9FUSO|nr:holo-ACP synthase [Cetobacterium ceti]SJZ97473.1 holo-[acyl-carrier-protein] synthase [Cetobacterium ceti]